MSGPGARGSGPLADRRDDLAGRVLLDVVPCTLQLHGPVVAEDLLPAPSLRIAERDVAGRPQEQRRPVADLRETPLDVGEERPAAEDLAREDRGRPPRA